LNSFGIHLEVSFSVICKYSFIILGVSSTKAEYLAQPHAHAPKPFIEEVEDEDCSPGLYPLPFESKGPIMIEVFPDHFFTEPYAEVEILGIWMKRGVRAVRSAIMKMMRKVIMTRTVMDPRAMKTKLSVI
jgi:hypothetical protein